MLSEKILCRVKDNALVKKYMNGEFTEKIYFLNAEGGYGKSTSFKSLYYYLVEQGTQANNHIVPIFIDVKQLVEFGEKGSAGNMPRPIEKYIVKHYCGEDSDPNESLLEKVVNLFSKNNAPKFQNHYTYFIFLDAINEVNDRQKQTIIDEIKQMAESDSVKFIISSRVNESSLPDDTVKYKLLPLNEEKIRVYLDKNFGKTGEKVDISKINDSLVDILCVPMYLSVFRKTYDERNPYPDIYEAKTVRKADILDSFIQKLLDDSKGKERSADKAVIEFVVKYFLPALAFLMANTNGFIIDSDSTEKLNCDYFKKFFLGTKKEVIKNLMNSEAYNPLSICCKTFSLLIENGDNFSFTHQNWRDLFVAKHIINCMNAEKLDELETPVSENVRQFAGELIREHKDDCGYSKDYMDKSDAEKTRKSECDFEDKDNLETWPDSPIEYFLQENYSLLNKKPIIIRNLIDIMKTSRNNNITAKYDNLNLSYVIFYGDSYNLSNSTFYNSFLLKDSFVSRIDGDVVAISINDGGEQIAILCEYYGDKYLITQNLKNNSYTKIKLPSYLDEQIGVDYSVNLNFISDNKVVANYIIQEKYKQNFCLYFDISNLTVRKEKEIIVDTLFNLSENKIVFYSKLGEFVIEIGENNDRLQLNGENLKLKVKNLNCICARELDRTKIEIFAGTDDYIMRFRLDLLTKACAFIDMKSNEYKVRKIAISKHSEKLFYYDDCGVNVLDLKTTQRIQFYINDFNRKMYVCGNEKVAIMVLYRWVNEICIVIIDINTKRAVQSLFFKNESNVLNKQWYAIQEDSNLFAVASKGKISIYCIGCDNLAHHFKDYILPEDINEYTIDISADNKRNILYVKSKSKIYQYELNEIFTNSFSKQRYLCEIQLQKIMYLNYSNIVGCDFSNSIFKGDDEEQEMLKTILFENGGKLKSNPKFDEFQSVVPVPIKKLIIDKMKSYNCKYEVYQINILRSFMIACLNLNLLSEEELYDSVDGFCKTVKNIEIDSNQPNRETVFEIKNNTLYIFCRLDDFVFKFFESMIAFLSKSELLILDNFDNIEQAAMEIYRRSFPSESMHFKENELDMSEHKKMKSKQDNTFTIIGDSGDEIKCEILFTFEDEKTGINYIAYTDNTMDEDGNTKVYASIFDPEQDNPELLPIETEEEWQLINNILESLTDNDED